MTSPMDFEQLVTLCQQTHEEIQKRAVRAVDLSLVVRNWLFGCYLVEFEQTGEDRASYGKRLLQALAERLKDLGIKGVTSTNLKLARQFYTAFRQIGQTPSDQFTGDPEMGRTASDPLPSSDTVSPIRPTLSGELNLAGHLQTLSHRFTLGWSHYVELLKQIVSAVESRVGSPSNSSNIPKRREFAHEF